MKNSALFFAILWASSVNASPIQYPEITSKFDYSSSSAVITRLLKVKDKSFSKNHNHSVTTGSSSSQIQVNINGDTYSIAPLVEDTEFAYFTTDAGQATTHETDGSWKVIGENQYGTSGGEFWVIEGTEIFENGDIQIWVQVDASNTETENEPWVDAGFADLGFISWRLDVGTLLGGSNPIEPDSSFEITASGVSLFNSAGERLGDIDINDTSSSSGFSGSAVIGLTDESNIAGFDLSTMVMYWNIKGESDGDVPDAPTLNSVDPGDGKAILYFAANGDGGTPITGYTAKCAAFSQAGTSSPITVSGLRNGLTYSCSVIATNVMGDSAPSAALSVTPEAAPSPSKVSGSFSGVWYNSDQSGHGLNIVTMDENITAIYWYVYHTDGTPMFLITVGINDGNRTEGTTYYNTGMKFGEFDPNDIQETVWGTSSVTFHSCNSATLEYSSIDPTYGSGTIPMNTVIPISGNKCTDSPLHGNYNGNWSDSDGVGYGLTALFENGDMIFYTQSDSTAGVGLGVWSLIGEGQFSYEATFCSVSGGSEIVSGSGAFNEDELSATSIEGGKLFATPMPGFQHSLDTAKMVGNYDIHDLYDVLIGSATIHEDGKITATTNAGCQVDGALMVPNADFNQAKFNASISGCGNTVNGEGAAVYRDAADEIIIAASDGWTGYAWTLKRK